MTSERMSDERLNELRTSTAPLSGDEKAALFAHIECLFSDRLRARSDALEEAARLCETPSGANRARENARGRALAKYIRALTAPADGKEPSHAD